MLSVTQLTTHSLMNLIRFMSGSDLGCRIRKWYISRLGSRSIMDVFKAKTRNYDQQYADYSFKCILWSKNHC